MKLKFNRYLISFLLLVFTKDCFFAAAFNSATQTTVDFQLTAFGELLTVQSVPYVQLKFTYNISSNYAYTSATGSGSVTATGGFALLNSGTGASGGANLSSRNRLIYNPGQGSAAMISALFPAGGVTGAYQIIGVGNTGDGFFFGYTGTQFGILWRSNSSGTPVDTWIPQTGWNVDTMNGTGPSQMTLNPTMGNVYKIQYQWLGFGDVGFFIESQTGNMQLVHQLQYPNQHTLTTIRNPSLQLRADLINFTATTTGAQIQTSAMVGFSEGDVGSTLNVRNSQEVQALSVGSTIPALTHVMTLYNKQTFQGKLNQVMVYPDLASIYTPTATNNVLFYIYLNPTFSTTGTFTDVNTNNSVVSYSTGTNTVVSSNGQLIGVLYTQGVEAVFISLIDKNIVMVPNDYLSMLAGKTTAGGGTPTAYVSVSWQEHF